MVRSPTRTTKRAQWTEDALKRAIQFVEEGKSMKQVSRLTNIPRSTLQNRLKFNNLSKSSLGRKPVFTLEQEEKVAKHVLSLVKMYDGISIMDFRRIAFALAEKNGIKLRFDKQKKMAGKKWVKGFLRRNPSVSLKNEEEMSLNNKDETNLNSIESFMNELGLFSHFMDVTHASLSSGNQNSGSLGDPQTSTDSRPSSSSIGSAKKSKSNVSITDVLPLPTFDCNPSGENSRQEHSGILAESTTKTLLMEANEKIPLTIDKKETTNIFKRKATESKEESHKKHKTKD